MVVCGQHFRACAGHAVRVAVETFRPGRRHGRENAHGPNAAEPTAPADMRVLHVMPGNGGGSGTSRAIRSAVWRRPKKQARPGDLFLLHHGRLRRRLRGRKRAARRAGRSSGAGQATAKRSSTGKARPPGGPSGRSAASDAARRMVRAVDDPQCDVGTGRPCFPERRDSAVPLPRREAGNNGHAQYGRPAGRVLHRRQRAGRAARLERSHARGEGRGEPRHRTQRRRQRRLLQPRARLQGRHRHVSAASAARLPTSTTTK